jgi:hypothetical protein
VPARASEPSLPDQWLRCPAGTPLRDSTALIVPESFVYRSSFPERHRIDWVDDVQLEAASSEHGPTAATALGL